MTLRKLATSNEFLKGIDRKAREMLRLTDEMTELTFKEPGKIEIHRINCDYQGFGTYELQVTIKYNLEIS